MLAYLRVTTIFRTNGWVARRLRAVKARYGSHHRGRKHAEPAVESQHDFQREYLEVRDQYLERTLLAEAPPADGIGACGHPALWRCVTCHGAPALCADCCLDTHERHPLHRIEFWAGNHYRSAALREIGLIIYCGHGGSRCPSLHVTSRDDSEASSADIEEDDGVEEPVLLEDDESDYDDEDDDLYYDPRPNVLSPDVHDLPHLASSEPAPTLHRLSVPCRTLVVVDVSGIHELPFAFCVCQGAPSQDVQLLDLGYYPASRHRPRTVFTTRVLDDFLLSNKECKASARNYHNKLRRTTNGAFPHLVPVGDVLLILRVSLTFYMCEQDRYKELLRVSRQWRNQKMRRWAGFGHRSESIGPGDLAVTCPACPQPGKNLPDDWATDIEK